MSEPASASGEIFVPALGVAMDEALLVRWTKQPGDAVEAEEPVAEIETDKATMDLVAPCAGFLGPHLFGEGAMVPVGEVVVRVLAQPGNASTPSTAAATHTPSAPEAAAGADLEGGTGRRPSPRARRLAREAIQRAEAAAPPAPEHQPRRDFRAIIAARVSESWRTIPHFAVTRAIDADALLAALARSRAVSTERITLTDLLLRALAMAVAETGARDHVDLGLAVATERGVAIPVLRDVLANDLESLARARAAAVQRAGDGHLDEDDVRDPAPATTLSNLGALGVDHFTGVIAVGQSTLLTVGRVTRQPVVDDAGGILVRARFNATLNADHRALDGADAAALLGALARAVAVPDNP